MEEICRWYNNIITYIKLSSIDYVLSIELFCIKFTFEEGKDNKMPFSHVLILRNSSSIESTVYRKFTHNDVYLHWHSFSPNRWRIGTLKTLRLRVFVVCSNEELLNKEMEYFQNIFRQTYGFPKAVIQHANSNIKESF